MSQAVTHFLIPVILLGIFRAIFIKNKKSFPVHYLFIGGLAGLLPDLDLVVYYILSFSGFTINEIHRTFSHNIFIPMFFVAFAGISCKFKNKELGKHHLKLKNIFLIIAFGIFVHLLIDLTIAGNIIPFYPFSDFAIGFNLINFLPIPWQNTFLPMLDAGMLVAWIIYLEVRHKISDFI